MWISKKKYKKIEQERTESELEEVRLALENVGLRETIAELRSKKFSIDEIRKRGTIKVDDPDGAVYCLSEGVYKMFKLIEADQPRYEQKIRDLKETLGQIEALAQIEQVATDNKRGTICG